MYPQSTAPRIVHARPIAPPAPPEIGPIEDLAAQLAGIHSLVDQATGKLARVLRPAPIEDSLADLHAPVERAVPRDPASYSLRDLVAGANRAANRLSALVDRIDL